MEPKLFSGHAFKLEKPCVFRTQPFLFSHWLLKPHTAWLVDGHQGEPSLKGLQTVTMLLRGSKTANSGHLRLAHIPYPIIPVTVEPFCVDPLGSLNPHLHVPNTETCQSRRVKLTCHPTWSSLSSRRHRSPRTLGGSLHPLFKHNGPSGRFPPPPEIPCGSALSIGR